MDRDRVEELGVIPGSCLSELINADPIFIHVDRVNLKPVIPKNLEGEKIGGLLNQNSIPGSSQKITQEVECLGDAVTGYQTIAFDLNAVVAGEKVSKKLPEPFISLFVAVLQKGRIVLAEKMIGRLLD
jgi:hypothetical protein